MFNEAKTGDIVLFKPTSLIGKIISFFDRSGYSHAGIVYGYINDKLIVFDIDWSIPKFYTIENADRDYAIYTVDLLCDDEREIMKTLMTDISVGYDWWHLLSYWRRILFNSKKLRNNPNKYTCIELVDRLYLECGINIKEKYPVGSILLNDVVKSDLTRQIYKTY